MGVARGRLEQAAWDLAVFRDPSHSYCCGSELAENSVAGYWVNVITVGRGRPRLRGAADRAGLRTGDTRRVLRPRLST